MKNLLIKNIARSLAKQRKKSKVNALNIPKLTIPYLWFFTDEIKTKNIPEILLKLPRLSGVVIRNYSSPDREKIIKSSSRISKRKNFFILVGQNCQSYGNINGIHLPKWHNQIRKKHKKHIISISVHGMKDVRKVINSRADIIFLSSVFRSSSHPEINPLGIIKFGLIARNLCKPVIALGGINDSNIKKLKISPINGIAAIDSLI